MRYETRLIDEDQFVRLSRDDAAMYKQAFGRQRLPEVRFRGDGSIEARLSQWWMLRGFFAAMKGFGRQQGPWPAASRPAIHWIFGWDHHLDWSTRKPIRRRKKRRKPPQPDQTGAMTHYGLPLWYDDDGEPCAAPTGYPECATGCPTCNMEDFMDYWTKPPQPDRTGESRGS